MAAGAAPTCQPELAGLTHKVDPGVINSRRAFRNFLYDEHATALNVRGCKITALPSDFFAIPAVIERLREFDCCDNFLEELPPSLGACINLEVLNCSQNRIVTLPALGACKALRVLRCHSNRLTELTAIEDNALHGLDCSWNHLQSLPASRDAYAHLEWLYCPRNQLETIPPGVFGSGKLFDLSCGDNALEFLPASISTCRTLERLECGGNKITTLPDLDACGVLSRVACNDNLLTSLPMFSAALKDLDCNRNRIVELTGLFGCPALETLACTDNKLETLPPALRNTALRKINVWGNPLSDIPDDIRHCVLGGPDNQGVKYPARLVLRALQAWWAETRTPQVKAARAT